MKLHMGLTVLAGANNAGKSTFEPKGAFASDILSSFNEAYDDICEMSGEFDGDPA